MARKERLELIRAIEHKRQSKVIAYVTSDRPGLIGNVSGDAIPVIERHVRRACTARTKKIDLFLYSRGGEAHVPWELVAMIREFLGHRPFGVLIPYRAHSAATVIALGADQIVMTRQAELGPIDATIERGPHNPREKKSDKPLPISVEDAMGYFSLLERVGLADPSHKMEAFSLLANQVHPLALGSVDRLLSHTQLVARNLLDSRMDPLTKDENERIVMLLTSEIYSHYHTIQRTEAKKSGLSYVQFADEEEIEKELWALYEDYADWFQMNKRFSPNDDLIISGDEKKEWKNLGLACVESISRKDFFSIDLRVQRLREVPPKVEINLPNLQLAIPPIPAKMNEEDVQKFIHQVIGKIAQIQIEKAADQACEMLVKSLPQKGFEHVQLNASWKKDTSPS